MSGWVAVAWGDEIPTGGVEPLLVDGREYVLYRDEEGLPHILDGHCRHLQDPVHPRRSGPTSPSPR